MKRIMSNKFLKLFIKINLGESSQPHSDVWVSKSIQVTFIE